MLARRALNIGVVAAPVAPLVIDLAAGLARRGHRVRIYAAESSSVPGVEVIQCTGLQRLFRRLRADAPDVVSQHAFDAQAIALAEGLPVLHTLHRPPTMPLVRACTQSRAPLVAASAFAAAQWRAAGVERVQTIRAGVPDFAPLGATVQPVALIAGRICEEKDTAAAIRASRAAGLRTHIVDAACLPRRELWQLMSQCAVCAVPIAPQEPCALVAAEAQVAGCPVVGYARAALPEIVEQNISGILVAPGDEAALARALRRALSLARHRVRASGRERLLLGPMLERYEAELTALFERSRRPLAQVIELAPRLPA